jgi:methionyl aminopeptidase
MFEHFNKLLSFFQDGKLSAQFEQTMLVTETGVDVLTARPGKPFTPYFMDS